MLSMQVDVVISAHKLEKPRSLTCAMSMPCASHVRVVAFFVEATANKSLPTASAPPPGGNAIRAGHRGRACGHFVTRGHHFGIPGTRRAPPSLRSHFSCFPVKPATEVPGDRPVPPLDQPTQKTTQV